MRVSKKTIKQTNKKQTLQCRPSRIIVSYRRPLIVDYCRKPDSWRF